MTCSQNSGIDSAGVFYLARGADSNAIVKFKGFVESYRKYRPGLNHILYVIFKGFSNAYRLTEGREVFCLVDHVPIFVEDDGFDLGAYFRASVEVNCQHVVFLNTSSQIRGHDWLWKLAANLELPGVGLVGCSGSFESPAQPGMGGLEFPNPHLRSNAFMIERRRFLDLYPSKWFHDKHDAHLFEHGPTGITRRIVGSGQKTLVVGRDGRGFEPLWWPTSETFRQRMQANLLVADNQTERFQHASIAEKQFLYKLCWGDGTFFKISGDPNFGIGPRSAAPDAASCQYGYRDLVNEIEK